MLSMRLVIKAKKKKKTVVGIMKDEDIKNKECTIEKAFLIVRGVL